MFVNFCVYNFSFNRSNWKRMSSGKLIWHTFQFNRTVLYHLKYLLICSNLSPRRYKVFCSASKGSNMRCSLSHLFFLRLWYRQGFLHWLFSCCCCCLFLTPSLLFVKGGVCSFLSPMHSRNLGNCEEELPKKPVGRLSADSWPTIGRLSADKRRTDGQQVLPEI